MLLKVALPGKAGGAPGNAFSLVYGSKTDKVYQNLYKVEPVLSEGIRWGAALRQSSHIACIHHLLPCYRSLMSKSEHCGPDAGVIAMGTSTPALD